jgi:multidrug efflux pump subunit AcrA (membrane-fusion protein)
VVHAVAQVDDPYGTQGDGESMPLAVGLFVEADISGREVENAVVLPRSAIRTDSRVLVVDDEDRLRFREVVVLRLDREEAIVVAGLNTGEKVCVSTLEAVTDGMKVRTVDVTDDSPATQVPEIPTEQMEARDDS